MFVKNLNELLQFCGAGNQQEGRSSNLRKNLEIGQNYFFLGIQKTLIFFGTDDCVE